MQRFDAGTGLASTAATAVGRRGITDMSQTFMLNESLGQNRMTFTVDGIVGTIALPIRAYTGNTFAAAIQDRVNQLQDPKTGRSVNSVTVSFDAVNNRLMFTSGTTGSNSQINVVGHANFGLANVTQTAGSVPVVKNLQEATDEQGNKLYVGIDGKITTQAPIVLQNWFPLYLKPGEISFDKNGQLTAPKESMLYAALDPKTGAAPLNIALTIGRSSTQTDIPFTVFSAYQDGNAAQNTSSQLPASLLGKKVLVPGAMASTDSAGTVNGAINLQSAATNVQLQILKTNGQLVKTINLGANPKGLTAFQWDGYDERGDWVGAGSYNIKATMTANGKQTQAETYVYGLVTSETAGPTGTRQKVTLAGMGDFNVADIRSYKF